MKTPYNIYRSVQKAPFQKISQHIEIVGSSSPRLNAMVQSSRLSIQAVLSKYYTNVGITIVNDLADLERLVAKKPDLVVLGMKLILLDPTKSYDDSPKLWLSDYLRDSGIGFTGSSTDALTLAYDKNQAKQIVIDAGFQSSRYFVSKIDQPLLEHSLSFPLFVKPTNRRHSMGIDEESVVYSEPELKSKLLSIHNDFSSDALIEEYLSGREFSVAVVKRPDAGKLLAMPIEITTPIDRNGNSFLSEAVKKADTEQVIAIHDDELKDRINSLAIGVFRALGSRDYGRIDMRLDAQGVPNFIEANLMPGLSSHGYLSRCFYLNERIDYEQMILSIVRLGLKRTTSVPLRFASKILLGSADEVGAPRVPVPAV